MKISKIKNLAEVGWVLLLIGGMAHMLPVQMQPLLSLSVWGISLQMVIGGISIYIALHHLLDKDE